MDREWTYRPPVLVGERVVWLGRSAELDIEERCEYGPQHGIVSWIGRVPEMGNHWTVGVEFDVDMPGGCDGTWNGRQLFNCPRSRGLFLPVSSLIKEKDFYNNEHTPIPGISSEHARTAAPSFPPVTSLSLNKSWSPLDLSLAPEPPPPKIRVPAPAIDIHTRNCMKQTGGKMEPSVSSGVISGGMTRSKMPEHFAPDEKINYLSVMTPSMASSSSIGATTSTVYSSAAYSTSTSKKDLLAERLVQSGAQDTSQECKIVSNKEKIKMNTSGSVRKTGLSGLGRGDDEDWQDEMSYFGETMVRKSTLPSCLRSNETLERLGQNRQPSVSTPSSPTLNDYQRQYGKKLSSSSTSTTASDVSKYMSSPGRYSMGDRPFPVRREKTSGFLNIFRWFRNRDKKRCTSVDRMSDASEGSMNSLSSTTSGVAHFPVMRSKSADTQKKMTSSKNQTHFGITRRYKFFSRDSSLGRTNLSNSNENGGRRLSAISASSDTSSKPDSQGTTLSRKKRPAPQPPGSPKTSDSESLKSQKSFTSLPSREPRHIIMEPNSTSFNTQRTENRKLQKSKSEGLIYMKVKRRAPLPPVQANVQSNIGNENGDNSSTLTRDGQKKRQAPSIPLEKSGRPLSTISTGSSLSQSPSSASTTLKSQNSSVNSSGATSSQYSAESMRLESGFLRQNIAKSSSSPAIPDTSKLSLSPRPWYKRKKNKDKENSKDIKESGKREKIYDSWMPDIQFSRSKLSISGGFRKSKSYEKANEDTVKKSKDDEKKEKRKSQVSLLANISELDRAASEQMQRELEQRKAQKETYDSKFYKTNEPHILTQTDFLPRTRKRSGSENSDMNTLSSSETATLRSLCSVRTEVEEYAFPPLENGIYDNLSESSKDFTLLQSYSKQTTLKIDEREGKFNNSTEIKQSASDASLFNSSQGMKGSMNPNQPSHSSRIADTPESSPSHVRESPMRRAAIDAELFYQLAKDSQTPAEPRNRNSPVLTGIKEGRKMPAYEEVSEEEEEDVSAVVNDSLGQFRRPSKNFGLRMNNFFSPDVSTIIEASESMTSSATTPADDIYDDLPVSSSINGREKSESIHDELNSEVNYEFHLNSTETREIMQELADVRQEIEKINEEEEEETRNRDKKRADEIREEVLLLRERDNFEVWKNAAGQTRSTNTDAGPPPPIELNEGSERKLKWICEMCTLINLPWRLQCEACMIRRPANPKRVDDDGKSLTSDHISSQPSVSDDSPVTVIHDDSNMESSRDAAVGAEAISPDNGHPLENEKKLPSNKKKRDINWERELQKYFKTFDEHVKGISDTTDSSGQNSETKQPKLVNISENEQGEKKKKSSQNEVGITSACTSKETENISKGAKPKAKFFGTGAGPPDTFIKNSDIVVVNQSESELETLEFTITESHSNEGLNKEPDMEQIRRARLAKFQGDGHIESGHMDHNDELSLKVSYEKNSKKKSGIKKKKESGLKSKNAKLENQESNRNEFESNENGSHARERDLSRHSNMEESQPLEDNIFCKKNNHKPQVLKPSGAVRSVVSIFNQFEQLQHAKHEKPRITRKKSSGNVVGRTQIFEQLNLETNSPELSRDNTRSKPRTEIQRDKEVFSAIAKFDEMAAMAEIERIEKQRKKNESTRRKPRLLSISSASSSETSENLITITAATTSHATSTVSSTTAFSQPFPENVNYSNVIFDDKSGSHSNENSEGVIKRGVLYTEQRKRSMSIGSGTFELIQAKDFETIEAQHTESTPSPEIRNITSPLISSGGFVASAVVPQIVIEPQDDQILPTSHSDNPTPLASEVRVEHEGQMRVEKKEVERLSRQLTDVDGIATFKATLKDEEPTLGQTNTWNITRLLKRLEGAISRGKHTQAAQLAEELAELRVSCSVTRSPKNKVNGDIITTLSEHSAVPPILPEDRQIAATETNLDLCGTQTPTSNMSECFYDASEMLDNEEMSISEHNHLLDFIDMDSIEQTLQVESPNTKVITNDSLNATVILDSRFLSPAPLQVSASAVAQNNTQTASTTEELYTNAEGQEEIIKDTSSPTANRRDTRVDPARREVKSDTISKLPDGPSLYMKDLSETLPPFNVKMYVEDKNSHQGPITFTVTTSMTVGELRKKVCQDFGFPPEVQRWILGRRLADDDSHTLEHHKVTTEGCPIFLYLVAPELEPQAQAESLLKTTTARGNSTKISRGCYFEHGSPRYLQVYDSEGNVEYRYYNPDTKKYEISVDTDDSDINDEEDSSEDEDTLEEDDEIYQNVAVNKRHIQENMHSAYISETRKKSDMQENENNNSVSAQPEENKYLLPQPLNAFHATTNVSSQTNTLHSTQCKEVSTSQTNSTSTSQIIQDQRSVQKYSQQEYKSLQPHSVEKHASDSTAQVLKDKTYTNQQQKLYHEITPDSQQKQPNNCQQQQESHIKQLSVTPKSQASNLCRDVSKEHLQSLPSDQSNVLHSHQSTEASVNEDCQVHSQSLQYTPQQQTLLPLSSQTKSLPAQTQLQCPQPKQQSQQEPSESPQSSQQHKQSRQTSQPLQQHPSQTLQQQPFQSSQHQSSQPVHQSPQSPKQLKQSKQQSQENQSSQLQQQSSQQQRNEENKDSTSHQLSEKQVDKPTDLSSSTKVHGWVCPRCTLVNKWTRPGCEACATERPGTVHPQAAGTSDKTPGINAVMSKLDRQGFVPNPDPFECCVCFLDINAGQGVVLRDCLHTFCRDCLANAIKYSDTADVKCPYRDNQYSCDSSLQDREIKALVTPQEYDKHLTKSVKQAEGTMQNVFHCKTPDCPGFCQFEDNVNSFHCDVCKKISCLTCQAQHEGTTCKEYQDDLAHKVDEAAMKTKKFFDDMIRRGDGLPCPKCSVMLVRKWGCDWMRCPMCRTEICWVTRGPRWGPGGPGDVSGGCKCGIRGQKCHPKCTYCH